MIEVQPGKEYEKKEKINKMVRFWEDEIGHDNNDVPPGAQPNTRIQA